MKNNLLKYVLILSLLLNFSFLGAAGYTYYKRPRTVAADALNGDPRTTHLFQQLSLKPEQIKLFQQGAVSFHNLLNKKRQEVSQLRKALVGLLRAVNSDHRAIDEAIIGINSKQHELQQMIVAHLLEFKNLLDQEQQKKFLDLIEGTMAVRKETLCP